MDIYIFIICVWYFYYYPIIWWAYSYTNIIFYDNQNKTLPEGQDLSTKILVDTTKLKLNLKNKTNFKIVEFENEKDHNVALTHTELNYLTSCLILFLHNNKQNATTNDYDEY